MNKSNGMLMEFGLWMSEVVWWIAAVVPFHLTQSTFTIQIENLIVGWWERERLFKLSIKWVMAGDQPSNAAEFHFNWFHQSPLHLPCLFSCLYSLRSLESRLHSRINQSINNSTKGREERADCWRAEPQTYNQ